MIWFRGEVIPDDQLRVSVLDRTFEHGLGLFESFRTWDAHPTLLPQHLNRLRHSAEELELPLESSELPDFLAVSRLAEAWGMGSSQDARLRITLSGGLSLTGETAHDSTIWMSIGALPPPLPTSGVQIDRTILVNSDDLLARHKTLNYWRMRRRHAQAVLAGADDVLCVTHEGLVCEASRSNIFVVEGDQVITPSTNAPLLPGVMRRTVIEHLARLGQSCQERPLTLSSLSTADEAFLTNSVRGILPISRLLGAILPAPGPTTQRIWGMLLPWLQSGGTR